MKKDDAEADDGDGNFIMRPTTMVNFMKIEIMVAIRVESSRRRTTRWSTTTRRTPTTALEGPGGQVPHEQGEADEDVGPGGQGLTGPLRLLRPLHEEANRDNSAGDDEDNSAGDDKEEYELAEEVSDDDDNGPRQADIPLHLTIFSDREREGNCEGS